MKIVLIGFMGSGKSTVADLLASALKLQRIDMDEIIVSRSGCDSIPEIFKLHGESYFRDLESQIAQEMACITEGVISSGGGVIGRPENIKALRQHDSTIVFLRTRFESVLERIQDTQSRPLMKDLDAARALHTVRLPIYEGYANLIVDTDGLSPAEICTNIIQKLQSAS